jgi:hypothetical protein
MGRNGDGETRRDAGTRRRGDTQLGRNGDAEIPRCDENWILVAASPCPRVSHSLHLSSAVDIAAINVQYLREPERIN